MSRDLSDPGKQITCFCDDRELLIEDSRTSYGELGIKAYSTINLKDIKAVKIK